MEEQIKKFVDLCIKFKKFTYETNRIDGWETIYKEDIDNEVKCYFASNSDHTAVEINGIQIGFHNTPKIECYITLLTEGNLKKTIKKYTKVLKQLKSELKQISDIEKEKDRKDRIGILEGKLKILKKAETL